MAHGARVYPGRVTRASPPLRSGLPEPLESWNPARNGDWRRRLLDSAFSSGGMIRAWKDVSPHIGARAFVDVSAQVIGDVTLGEDASVWMNSVVRGDVNWIRIGARSNVQDNSVLHVTSRHPTALAEDVTIGHSVNLHGCTIERLCLIGIGAIVLNGVVVGEESIVAAGTLVPEGMQVPPRSLVMGTPARVRREVTDEERAELRRYALNYLAYKEEYRRAEGAL